MIETVRKGGGEHATSLRDVDSSQRTIRSIAAPGGKGNLHSFEEMVQSGLRKALIEGLLLVEADEVPSGLLGGERWAFYAKRLSDKIEQMGGLGLGDTPEEVLEALGRDRQQLWEEKYAAYLERK